MVPLDAMPVLPNARDAVLALHHAERALRLRPGEPKLFQTALRQCLVAVGAATVEAPLALALKDGAVQVGGVPVLSFGQHEAPFGPLRAAGIGELVLQRGVAATTIDTLVRRLAALANGESDLAALATTAGLPGVQLRVATNSEDRDDPAAIDWSAAPPPSPRAACLAARIDRELGANLAAVAARQLLDDLTPGGLAVEDLLRSLFARMLREDVPSAAWLLTEVANHPVLPPTVLPHLTTLAQQHVDAAWLQRRLHDATRDELLSLAAFVMQLGDDAAARFARAAATTGHPLSSWLCSLLGQQP
ncbi:MAG: hypothetical protein IT455_18170 [Planctomycetes bacterium]|nr:hypothetical protein [Planctomycetota bacterium]